MAKTTAESLTMVSVCCGRFVRLERCVLVLEGRDYVDGGSGVLRMKILLTEMLLLSWILAVYYTSCPSTSDILDYTSFSGLADVYSMPAVKRRVCTPSSFSFFFSFPLQTAKLCIQSRRE
jgi:hypothetical protein